MPLDPVFPLVVKAGMALLFAFAAWHKLRDWPRIGAVIGGYRLLPPALSQPVAVLLVVLELVAAAGALLSPSALWLSAGLLSAYAAAIGFNLLRGNDQIDCGCIGFAAVRPRLRWTMVIRNAVLAALALLAVLQPVADRSLVWIDYLTLLAVLPGAALLYAALETAISLPSRGAAS